MANTAGAIQTNETTIQGRKRGRSRTRTRYRGPGVRAMGRPFAAAAGPFAYFTLPASAVQENVGDAMAEADAPRPRIQSLDIVRGAVMVLMAIDHVRVYSGVPAGGPTAGIFFTRWITHFCAPAFVFFAGTSAFLYGRRSSVHGQGQHTAVLARYLMTRGLILVLLELTVIRASWTFGFDYSQFILAGVIWMLGWCMVLLAGLVWLPPGPLARSG